jgi:hypothetical protein
MIWFIIRNVDIFLYRFDGTLQSLTSVKANMQNIKIWQKSSLRLILIDEEGKNQLQGTEARKENKNKNKQRKLYTVDISGRLEEAGHWGQARE